MKTILAGLTLFVAAALVLSSLFSSENPSEPKTALVTVVITATPAPACPEPGSIVAPLEGEGFIASRWAPGGDVQYITEEMFGPAVVEPNPKVIRSGQPGGWYAEPIGTTWWCRLKGKDKFGKELTRWAPTREFVVTYSQVP